MRGLIDRLLLLSLLVLVLASGIAFELQSREQITIRGEDRSPPAGVYHYEMKVDTGPFDRLRVTEDVPQVVRRDTSPVYSPLAGGREPLSYRPEITDSDGDAGALGAREMFLYSLGTAALLMLLL